MRYLTCFYTVQRLVQWNWFIFVAAAAKSLVMSRSVRPHRWQPTRLPHPWDSSGKNTGVGCHFLLQCMKVKLLSRVRLLATPWTAAYQAPPSMGFSRQEYWSGVPLPSPKVMVQGCKLRAWDIFSCSFYCLPKERDSGSGQQGTGSKWQEPDTKRGFCLGDKAQLQCWPE